MAEPPISKFTCWIFINVCKFVYVNIFVDLLFMFVASVVAGFRQGDLANLYFYVSLFWSIQASSNII